MKTSKNQQGFLLVELVVYLAIASILLAGAGSVLFAALRQWGESSTQTMLQNSVFMAVDLMSREIRYAKDISVSDATISFTEVSSGKRYQYFYNGVKTLYRVNLTDAYSRAQPVAGGYADMPVEAFRVALVGDDSAHQAVTIELTLAGKSWTGQRKNTTMRTTVFCRNQSLL